MPQSDIDRYLLDPMWEKLRTDRWVSTRLLDWNRSHALAIMSLGEYYGKVERRVEERTGNYEWRLLKEVVVDSIEEYQSTDQPLALGHEGHDLNRGIAVVRFTDIEGEHIRVFDEYGFLNINAGAARRFAATIEHHREELYGGSPVAF